MNDPGELVHYNAVPLDLKKIEKVYTRPEQFVPDTKPNGGLWSSPVDSCNSWIDFAVSNNFYQSHCKVANYFRLKETARILKINSFSDVEKLPKIKLQNDSVFLNFPTEYPVETIDYDKLILDYDALWIEDPWGIRRKEYRAFDIRFGAWDVDTVLIFRPEVINGEIKSVNYAGIEQERV